MGVAEEIYRRAPVWMQNIFLNLYALRIEQQRYGKSFRQLLDRWERSQWWEPERIQRWQDDRLSRIVDYAYENIPFYRKRFREHSVRPEDVEGVTHLSRLPILTKDQVRAAGRELTNGDRNLVHGHTSGTTGTPLDLWYDRGMCVVNNAADWRQKMWAGMRPGDWLGLLLGRIVVPLEQQEPPFWRVNRIHNQVWFSAFHLTSEHLPAYAEEMRRRGLRYLEGYPSTLYVVAKHLLDQGERLPLVAVFTSSETLHAVQREVIEEAFCCTLYDFYGLAERIAFAGECEEHEGKHLFQEYAVTEIVDDDGRPVPAGERGWLTGTTLWNRGMPLLRYRTSDMSRKLVDGCPCGRGLGRISAVTTKAEDIVVTPEGRFVSPSVLTHPFKPFHQLEKSQIIQEERDRVVVKLVAGPEFTHEDERSLLRGLRERLGDSVAVESVRVEEIPPDSSGKFRWVISKVDHSCQVEWDENPDRRRS